MENYDKLKEIGKGSYGVVWLVKHKKDRKNYVLKQIDLRKTTQKDLQSAQQEAKLLSKLKHPNIVSYKDSFQTNGYLYIVMLYCEGGDLYSHIKQQNGKSIEETQIVEWFVQIAMALQYMHERHILHRDLKTQNIFLTKNKIIKVGDLGIARVLKSSNDMATTIIGTPYYMSPELFTNQAYNSKSDVWALGCCVYEMATLKHAFNAKNINSLASKIITGKMPPIPDIYSKELIGLIEAMLQNDAKKRPSVNRILKDSYIRHNISLFLERTKQRQKQLSSSVDSDKPQQQHLRPSSSSSSSSSQLRKTPIPYENNKPQIGFEKIEQDIQERLVKKERPKTVRISSVVDIMDNRNPFKINESETKNEDMPVIRKSTARSTSSTSSSIESIENKNKPVKKAIVEENAQVVPKVLSTPVVQPNDEQSGSSSNISARERRRQKLRLSQSAGESDSKPPLLRAPKKIEKQAFAQYQSENYDNNDRKVPSNSVVSQSYTPENKIPAKQLPFKDSLKLINQKLFRDNLSNNGSRVASSINNKAPVPLPTKIIKSQTPSTCESSSTSLSGEEDDPQLISKKQKEKEKKEVSNFIDCLNSTLNQANKNNNQVKKEEYDSDTFEDDEDDEMIELKENNSNDNKVISKVNRSDVDEGFESYAAVTIGTLNATKTKLERMKLLEQECLRAIGRNKLDQAFDILDGFQEYEIEPKLVKLLGKEYFELYSGKIWEIKFFNDYEKIRYKN